jgi:hypothetical protein
MFIQFFEGLTIGLPFCAFKIITGLYLGHSWLVVLGFVDTFINLFNMLGIVLKKKRFLNACLLSIIISQIKRPNADTKMRWEDFGNSLDVVLSFALVALMISMGNLKFLPENHLIWWNVSVVLNVFGAGLSRITDSLKNLP